MIPRVAAGVAGVNILHSSGIDHQAQSGHGGAVGYILTTIATVSRIGMGQAGAGNGAVRLGGG